MPDPADNLTPADPSDLAESIAFALRFEGRKRKHDAAEYMAAIAAEPSCATWSGPGLW